MSTIGQAVYRRSENHPTTSAGLVAPAWTHSPRGEPVPQSPRAYGSTKSYNFGASRSRPTPAPYVVRPDTNGPQRQILYEHVASPRYPTNGQLTGPQVAAKLQSQKNAASAASQAAEIAQSQAVQKVKTCLTPSDWRLQCNRKAEELITFRNEQRRETARFYQTQRPDMCASGRYTYNRFGLGDADRANKPWSDQTLLNHSAGFSTDKGSGQIEGVPYEEALDDAWLRDRRRTQHTLSVANAKEQNATANRLKAQTEVDEALGAEHYQARLAAYALEREAQLHDAVTRAEELAEQRLKCAQNSGLVLETAVGRHHETVSMAYRQRHLAAGNRYALDMSEDALAYSVCNQSSRLIRGYGGHPAVLDAQRAGLGVPPYTQVAQAWQHRDEHGRNTPFTPYMGEPATKQVNPAEQQRSQEESVEHEGTRDVLHLMHDIFSAADANGDGVIDKSELSGLFASLMGQMGVDDQDVDAALRACDTNCDGVLTFEEACGLVCEEPWRGLMPESQVQGLQQLIEALK